ncbi:DUF4129 domain-containing protein [Candidatus Bathyarchaeota archaeon]|nr:MAG: DUF4129 domain-containing protein [Candidatus Bathyarchaeota archaeon]
MLYMLSLAPLVGLGLMVGLIILLVYNSRLFSDSLGYGIAGKRKRSKKGSMLLQLIIALAAWVVALQVLVARCNGIFCTSPRIVPDNSTQIAGAVPMNQTINIPLLGAANRIGNFVQTNWFYAAFLGLLVVSSVIVARGIIMSWQQTKAELAGLIPAARAEAITSVEDAFRILKAQPESDPRTRIINCYQRMVQAAQRLGASITSDQTARELEAAVSRMLMIKGSSLRELTDLFEEARYSLHPITETDAEQAQQCLLSIAGEMNITLSV